MRSLGARLLVGAALTLAVTAAAHPATLALSSEVTLSPMEKAGAYLASVEIRDAASQELLSAPRISFMKGEPASATTELPSGETVLFSIEVAASGSKLTYSAEIQQGGKSVASQKATIALAR